MNRRQWVLLSGLSGAAVALRRKAARAQKASGPTSAGVAQDAPDKLLLKDYRPKSIYKIPVTDVRKAKYPIIDVHCHGPRPPQQVDEMVKLMDTVGVEKTVIFTGAITSARFSEVRQLYSKYPGRFDLWCGFNLTGIDQPGFGPDAVKSLEECHRMGAVGVGELSDKGRGFGIRSGTGRGGRTGSTNPPVPSSPSATGPHPDDSRMDPLFEKCAQLGMPVNVHVSDPIWAYEPMDRTNDGLMNAYTWMIKLAPGIMGHNELVESLERMTRKHPKTLFIACHLANIDYDLARLSQMLDRNPNLYVDISARFGDLAPIPRFVAQFIQKHADRVLYGTDMAYSQRMFSSTFRIMETLDEHFYEFDLDVCYDYHWPLHGLGLRDDVLKKVYRENALNVFKRARNNAV